AVIGQPIDLAGETYSVIGVAPRGFSGIDPSEIDVWVPITTGVTPDEFQNWQKARQSYWITVVARARTRLTLKQAAAKATLVNRANTVRDGDPPADVERERRRIELTSTLPREANADRAEAKVALLLGTMSLLV